MKAGTMLDTISSLLGTPACAIPLSSCRLIRPHLLERAGLPLTGTVIFFAVPYVLCEDVDRAERTLSLYAVPRDYHGYMRELSDAVLPSLRQQYPSHRFALFSDHSPVAEVDGAARAGLGVLGCNGLLLNEAYGSFVFLGEIITDVDFVAVTGSPPSDIPALPPRCEGCGACLQACPARDGETWVAPCLSELTQKKGMLTDREQELLTAHPLVWGCDTCQLACPHNRRVLAAGRDTPIRYFREKRINRLTPQALEAMSEEEFSERAFAWRGRAVIQRNLTLKEAAVKRANERKEHTKP